MVIYVSHMVAQKQNNVNSIAAENSYLASDSNAFQFLIRRVFVLQTAASKMKFITREIQI